MEYADGTPFAGRDLVDAIYKESGRTLQIAGRPLSGTWGEFSNTDHEVIVMEVNCGWVPTRTVSGVSGQGP